MTSGWPSSLLDLTEAVVIGPGASPRVLWGGTKSGLRGEIPSDPVAVVGVPESTSDVGSEWILLPVPNRWSAKCELNTVETGLKLNATKSVLPGGALCTMLSSPPTGEAKFGLGSRRGPEFNEPDPW